MNFDENDEGPIFHVLLVKGKALPIPCKYEARRRRGHVRPRLPYRCRVLLSTVSKDMAYGFARGYNAGRKEA